MVKYDDYVLVFAGLPGVMITFAWCTYNALSLSQKLPPKTNKLEMIIRSETG